MSLYDDRKRLKNHLIIVNFIFCTTLLAFAIFYILVVRAKQLDAAIMLHQHILLDLTKLPKNTEVYINYTKDNNVDQFSHIRNDQEKFIHQSYVNSSQPQIAIIVTNLGLHKLPTELAVALPSEVGLGFIPYTSTLKPLLYKAKEDGHEIYLNLPFSNNNRNTYSLHINRDIKTNTLILQNILKLCSGYHGFYISHKENIVTNAQILQLILEEATKHNLLLILSKNDIVSMQQDTQDATQHTVVANVIIDQDADEGETMDKLEQLAQYASLHHKALGYVHGYAITINILKDWIATLQKRNIQLVPVSQL